MALRFFRKRARLTQDELGRAVGYSREYIAQLEGSHRKPDPSVIAALFIPALDLTQASDEAMSLLELAASARDKSLRDYGITILYKKRVTAQIAKVIEEDHPSVTSAFNGPSDRLGQTLSWYIEMDPEAALRLANALEPMWMAQSNFREAQVWFGRILACSTSATVSRAEALLHASRFAQRQGDAAEALRLAKEARSIYRARDNIRGVCFALAAMGWAALGLGEDIPYARTLSCDSFALARQLNEPRFMLDPLLALIHDSVPVSADEERWPEIEADLDEYERLAHELNNARGMAFASAERGFLEIARGDLCKALQCQRESLRMFRLICNRPEIGWGEMAVGEVLWFKSELGKARHHFARGLRVFRQAGQSLGITIALHHLAQVDRREGRLEAAARRYVESLRMSVEAKNANMVARCIAGLGGVALANSDIKHAAMLLACAQAQFDAIPSFLSQFDIADYRRMADQVCLKLGDVAFEQLWAEGRELSLDEAIALAMA